MTYQQRKYKLVNTDNGNSIILDGQGNNYEPKNWKDSDKEFKRSTKNFAITTELSKNLEFTGAGAAFLISAYESKGIEANVKMFEYRYDNPNSWEYVFMVGDFDFSDFKREKNIVKVPFNSGGLNSLLKSKLNDKFELDRNESINGVTLPTMPINEFAIQNRPLFLDSLLEVKELDNNSDVFRMKYSAGSRYGLYPIPTTVTYESDDSVLSVFNDQFDVIGFSNVIGGIRQDNPFDAVRSNTFYYNADVDKTIKVEINIKIRINITRRDDLIQKHLSLRLAKMAGGENPTMDFGFISDADLINNDNFPEFDYFKTILNMNEVWTTEPYYFQTTYIEEVSLKKGDSLALYLFGGGDFFENFGNAYLNLNSDSIECSISVQENSLRTDLPRRANFAFNKDVGNQLMGIINDDITTYKSDFFNNSEFNLTGLSSGKMIRGFTDSSITTSLKDFFNNSRALFNMAYNIEMVNGKETIIHEPLRYFFRNETKIKINQQVSNIKRSVAKEFIYSTVKSGYKKPSGDNLYEEVNGLNEVNVTNEYTTPITRVVKDYDIESPYRADSEGKELTLRKSITIFPTEDYRTDKTIFNLDLVDVGTDVYAERLWQQDYEEQPKGVFSPDTLTGLRFTPFRNMQRHFWFLNNAFTKFTDKYIRYSNTRGNSELITKKENETEKKENGNYQVSTLENAIFVSEWIEFDFPLDSELLNEVYGYTIVDGNNIPNTYFKIEFINEFNRKEYGYLFSLKPNKEGKWKLLKAL